MIATAATAAEAAAVASAVFTSGKLTEGNSPLAVAVDPVMVAVGPSRVLGAAVAT